eukprot:scaffold62904_cov43-Prasinocladus_malaysianus.AAC.1
MGCSASTLRHTSGGRQGLSDDIALRTVISLSSADKEAIKKLIRNAMSLVPRRVLKQFAVR